MSRQNLRYTLTEMEYSVGRKADTHTNWIHTLQGGHCTEFAVISEVSGGKISSDGMSLVVC